MKSKVICSVVALMLIAISIIQYVTIGVCYGVLATAIFISVFLLNNKDSENNEDTQN